MTNYGPILLGAGLSLFAQIVVYLLAEFRDKKKRADEKTARTFTERQRAYLAFLRAWDYHRSTVAEHWFLVAGNTAFQMEPPEDWLDDLISLGLEVELFGSREAVNLVEGCMAPLQDYAMNEDDEDSAIKFREKLMKQFREDLRVPPSS